jgi:hypothetical protein
MDISEADFVAALDECKGNKSKVANKLGMNLRTVQRRVDRMIARGYAPDYGLTKTVPPGYSVGGVSTLYDDEGNIKIQWVKSKADETQKAEAVMREVFDALRDQLPRAKPVKAPERAPTDLLNLFVLTDFHLGMLSWHEETGEDWDLEIAQNLLVNWFATAIKMAPKADKAVFCQLGDFLHWDGMDAVTPASKHLLDADTRFQKLVRVAIRVVRTIIDMLLRKYPQVHVLAAEGNHDPASSIWLREWLCVLYEDEPRVTVETSPDPYYCVEHGQTSLFFHHGHKRKPANVDSVFTAKFREVFGRTRHSYAHMGHLHHIDQKETNLMVVEQHRTLAAPDAYASRGGWMSGRDAQVITYHAEHGEVGRIRINARMVK